MVFRPITALDDEGLCSRPVEPSLASLPVFELRFIPPPPALSFSSIFLLPNSLLPPTLGRLFLLSLPVPFFYPAAAAPPAPAPPSLVRLSFSLTFMSLPFLSSAPFFTPFPLPLRFFPPLSSLSPAATAPVPLFYPFVLDGLSGFDTFPLMDPPRIGELPRTGTPCSDFAAPVPPRSDRDDALFQHLSHSQFQELFRSRTLSAFFPFSFSVFETRSRQLCASWDMRFWGWDAFEDFRLTPSAPAPPLPVRLPCRMFKLPCCYFCFPFKLP